jgi:hypothetical protein
MGDLHCAFPLFRARYFSAVAECHSSFPSGKRATEGKDRGADAGKLERPHVDSSGRAPKGVMRKLNLRLLSRDDGPPTEVGARRHKMAQYEKKCSKVLDGLYISGEFPARDLPTLQAYGITHVINCVGSLYPAYHPGKCVYKTLYLEGARCWPVLRCTQ